MRSIMRRRGDIARSARSMAGKRCRSVSPPGGELPASSRSSCSQGQQKMQDPDYIIVGAGSAGAGLAYQLARDGRRKILLLEAGPSHRHPFVSMPKGIGKILASERHTWRYQVDSDDSEAPEHWVRGRLLGGSSAINGMMYFRGQKADYDDWAEAGATGWDGE